MMLRRYPGIRPFEFEESHLFFGRDRDMRDLNVLIMLEKLVVLFGKSGFGKSSLINAGLLPMLQAISNLDDTPIIPIVVRFGSFDTRSGRTLIDVLLGRLNEITPLEHTKEPHFLDDLVTQSSLWYHFKKRQSNLSSTDRKNRYLLIFDQFEEFFTYPLSQQEMLKTQLAELVYTEIPQSIRSKIGNLQKEQRQFLVEPLDVKVLFVIRSDRINLLHAFGSKFPAILDKRNRFELKGLSPDQVEAAATKPAQQEGNFISPTFEFSPEAIRAIIDKLDKHRSAEERPGIETFQLQVLCEYLESEIIAGKIPARRIEPVHFVEKLDAIYEGYYHRQLSKLPTHSSAAAQRLIEESLIFEDPKTGEARRLSVDADVLVQEYANVGVTHETLRELENAFLLRREFNSVGGFSYEVSHDTLIGAILNLKKEREAREAAEAAKIAIRNRRRRYALFAASVLLILAGSAGAIWYVLQLKNQAEENLSIALASEEKVNQAFEQATQSQHLAEDERAKAEQNFNEATTARLETEETLEKLEDAHVFIAKRIFDDADVDIRYLKYDQALQRIYEFQSLEVSGRNRVLSIDTLRQRWESVILELAYFQNESGRPEEAFQILQKTMATSFEGTIKKEFGNIKNLSKLPKDQQKQKITSILFEINQKGIELLQTRYYPLMIRLKGGSFIMGRDSGELDEKPRHSVVLNNFELAHTEVTVWQYNLYMTAVGRNIFNDKEIDGAGWDWEGDNPIVWINFYDAIQYANWLSQRAGLPVVYVIDKTQIDTNNINPDDKRKWLVTYNRNSKGFRLPTEAEWEYAARGGINQSPYLYSGSDDYGKVSWHADNADSRTQSVATKQPNALGIYDMSGNVWEWCWDWHGNYPTDGQTQVNPIGATSGKGRVVRGGSWYSYYYSVYVYNRHLDPPGNRRSAFGFRLARNSP